MNKFLIRVLLVEVDEDEVILDVHEEEELQGYDEEFNDYEKALEKYQQLPIVRKK